MTEQNQSNRGIVYLLSNEAMEGYLKIGMTSGESTTQVVKRMKELDSTGVPRPFKCEYAAVVEDAVKVEQALHEIFGDRRVRTNREFFQDLAAHRVVAAMRLVEIKVVTPGDLPAEVIDGKVVTEKPPRRSPFKFAYVKLEPGAQLQWSRNPLVTCEVVNDKQVNLNGTLMTLSAAAASLGYLNVAGPDYWMYEDETLSERRRRIEEEDGNED